MVLPLAMPAASTMLKFAPLALSAAGALFSKKKDPYAQQVPTVGAGQSQLINQILAAARGEDVGGIAGDLFGPQDDTLMRQQFQEGFADPAMRQFQEQTAPQLREETLMAGLGSSSAGQDVIGRESGQMQQSLNEQLSRLLMGAGEQRRGQQMDFLSRILGTQTFQNVQRPGRESGITSMLKGMAPEFGKFAMEQASSAFGKMFSGGGSAAGGSSL